MSSATPKVAQHTPGPYRVEHNAWRNAYVVSDHENLQLAHVRRLTPNTSECEIREANARLFAAAPDLLAALKAAQPLIVLATYEFRDDEEARLRYEALQAVIIEVLAKAGA